MNGAMEIRHLNLVLRLESTVETFFIAGVWSMVCAFNFSKLRIKFPNYALTGGLALLVYSASYLGFKTERVFSLKSWPAHSPTPDTRPTGHSPRPHLVEELSVK